MRIERVSAPASELLPKLTFLAITVGRKFLSAWLLSAGTRLSSTHWKRRSSWPVNISCMALMHRWRAGLLHTAMILFFSFLACRSYFLSEISCDLRCMACERSSIRTLVNDEMREFLYQNEPILIPQDVGQGVTVMDQSIRFIAEYLNGYLLVNELCLHRRQ